MELVIAMPNVHMMSNSLTARPIPSIGLLQRQILIREVESMGLAVQKWISGRPILDLKPLLPILARYPDYSDVMALIVVIMTQETGKKSRNQKFVRIFNRFDLSSLIGEHSYMTSFGHF